MVCSISHTVLIVFTISSATNPLNDPPPLPPTHLIGRQHVTSRGNSVVHYSWIQQFSPLIATQILCGCNGVHEVTAVDQRKLDALKDAVRMLLLSLGVLLKPSHSCFKHLSHTHSKPAHDCFKHLSHTQQTCTWLLQTPVIHTHSKPAHDCFKHLSHTQQTCTQLLHPPVTQTTNLHMTDSSTCDTHSNPIVWCMQCACTVYGG